MKLKSRILVGLSIFLLCVCAFTPSTYAMWSDVPAAAGIFSGVDETDDVEVPLDLGGVGAKARDSLRRDDVDSWNPQNQLFVAALAGDVNRLSSLVADARVHTRTPDANGDTMWHILIREKKWPVITKLLGCRGGIVMSAAVVKRCQISFAQCITKGNDEYMTPLDLARADGNVTLLKSCMPATWSITLPKTFPTELRRFK